MNANTVLLVYIILFVICALLGAGLGSLLARKYESPRNMVWWVGGGVNIPFLVSHPIRVFCGLVFGQVLDWRQVLQ